MKDKNSQQDKDIEVAKTDIGWIKTEIRDIKDQVFNHIPTSIKELKEEFVKYKLSNNKWLISILVSLIFIFIGMIANLIFK